MATSTTTRPGRYPNPITRTQTRIGWVGIGIMGHAMATRLLTAGYTVTIYARTPSKASSLLSLGATLSPSLSHLAATSDVIFTMLSHPADVIQTLQTLIPYLPPNTILIDHTSSRPDYAVQIFNSAAEKFCYSIDAPVSGGDTGARDGKLAIFAGGDLGVVEWLGDLWRELGVVSYMGECGKGQSCKIANQIMVGGSLVGLCEGLVFAGKAGLDKKGFVEAVRGGAGGSMAMEIWGERIVERDFRAGGFAEYMVKDLGMVGGEGGEEGGKVVVLPGAELSRQMFVGMVGNGDGKMGTQGVITVIERINGIRGRA